MGRGEICRREWRVTDNEDRRAEREMRYNEKGPEGGENEE